MRIVFFCHSLVSDWNHGNAHFLRGIVSELLDRGHEVRVFEPAAGWSVSNLRREHGERPFDDFRRWYPHLRSTEHAPGSPDLARELEGADLVIAHEWNEPELIARLGRLRASGAGFLLLFHDTHHRSVTAPHEMERFDLSGFDGALAFGRAVAEVYRERGWARRVWVWHEAADARVFRPKAAEPEADLVWIGNWGDEERSQELEEFLVRPVRDLGLRAIVHGVRYPEHAVRALRSAGIEYRGWLPNFRAPEVYARHRLTVHVPRRPYAQSLPGIPTIRVFEALACGIPLICSPWRDSESLFGDQDFLVGADGREMTELIRRDLEQRDAARARAVRARVTILRRHTCAHRADELMSICRELGLVEEPAVREVPVGSGEKEEVA
ncbi:MAG TPA: glycosyltransferase [Phycisphaerales bacterium]|nr:glycosyltransferase [Phycisphaerales bacterium]